MNQPPDRRNAGEASPLKLTLAARNAREQYQALLSADPIAIVGLGCRLPGKVDDLESFWTLLANGVDAVTEVPPGRWDVDALYDPDPAAPGKAATKWGGFVADVDRFDAGFFGIMRREAERMDPQQRLFLEVAVEALDHAGLTRERLAGSRAGVFIASYYNDYAQLAYQDPASINARTLTGTVHSVLANRLSYLLDLRGPSISVDTACSSSLVAIHLACQSLRFGECDTALAGGVSLMLTEGLMISLSKVGFMAPDGRCKTFDASADGFGRGEGCGVLVMKRLSDAVADNDRVLALIRGSAVNQDGHSTVLAAPNGLAQQALIREALSNARLDASRIGYVEAHGTGTPLGDPIEVEALALTVGVEAPGAGRCLMGTAKANVGHLEAAAGVTGVIKSVLVLQKAAIPPQVHFKRLNPHISLAGTRLAVAAEMTPWPNASGSRCAGVSGFGVGGTNAHVVMEEAPKLPAAPALQPREQASMHLLPLSAQDPSALEALARRWVDMLATTGQSLSSLCACAGSRRSHYDHRLGVVGATPADIIRGLNGFLDGISAAAVASASVAVNPAPRLAFVFSGQGQQWLGMGRELLEDEPVFREAMEDIDERFRRISTWSILEELAAPAEKSRLDETEVAQPAIFALQVALSRLWEAWGYVPEGVVGHSVGEVAALHVAGVITLDDGLRIVLHRGRAMQRAAGTGSMVAVSLSENEAGRYLEGAGQGLSIAAVNGPGSVVLSGERSTVQRTVSLLAAQGLQHRMLPVDYAFHSSQMDPFGAELERLLGSIEASPPALAVYSTVTGGRLHADATAGPLVDAAYFGRNIRATVRFAASVDAMLADGFGIFLELSAHPVLGQSVAECAAANGRSALPLASLRRGRPSREALLQATAWLYAALRAPAWEAINGGVADVVDLPAYPWQRQRYWLPDPAKLPPEGVSARIHAGHELLGERISTADATIFETRWPAAAPDWLNDHRIGGRLLVPAAAMVESMRAAAARALGRFDLEIADFLVHQALFLSEGQEPPTVWQTIVRIADSGSASVSIHQQIQAGSKPVAWHLVASAAARVGDREPAQPGEDTVRSLSLPDRLPGQMVADVASLYATFQSGGIAFGPSFRVLADIAYRDGEGCAWLVRQDDDTTPPQGEHYLHPALLDGALQACVIVASGTGEYQGTVLLPMGIERYRVVRAVPSRLRALVSVRQENGQGSLCASVRLTDEDGELVALVDGARFVATSAAAVTAQGRVDDWIYELDWRPDSPRPRSGLDAGVSSTNSAGGPSSGPASGPHAWILLCDAGGLAEALSDRLEASGHRCLRVGTDVRQDQHPGAASRIDPDQQSSWGAIFEDTQWQHGLPLGGIVHLSALDGAPDAVGKSGGAQDAAAVMHLVQAMVRATLPRANLTLVSRGAQAAAGPAPTSCGASLWGLHGVVAVEHPEFNCRIVDLDPEAALADAAGPLADYLLETVSDTPARLAVRHGRRLIPRLQVRAASAVQDPPTRLVPGRTVTLDALSWQSFTCPSLGPGEVRVEVAAAGVNFRDALLALGMYPDAEASIGAECAGIVHSVGEGVVAFKPGDRVFGFVEHAFASQVVVKEGFLCRMPDAGLTFERAAALPVAFLTAIVGLQRIAGLEPGQRVLIHAATGGVGMAAVQVAHRAGAEVFASAGSPAKRRLLEALGVRHVFDSRSLDFAPAVREATGGAGVDVVLNSLAGDFIGAGVSVLKSGGWFLELGKRGIWSDDQFAQVRPDAHYRAYDLGDEARSQPASVRPMLELVLAGIADGSFTELPVRVYPYEEAAEAFRFMAQARHVGKLVLRNSRMTADPALVGSMCRRDGAYLVSGGVGGLGLETARWLVEKGAGALYLVGRHGPGEDAGKKIEALRAAGAEVHVIEADVADHEAMRSLLLRIQGTGRLVRGVVHAAGTLEDGLILRQDPDRFSRAFRGKADGARVLDQLTRTLPLEFFVLFSSASQWLGAPGQGPYSAANAEADAVVRSRVAVGLPGLSVAWGQWRDHGMAARMAQAGNATWSDRGLGWIDAAEGFARLERLLSERAVGAIVLPIDWGRYLSSLPEGVDASFFEALSAAYKPAKDIVRETSAAARPDRVAQWLALPESQRRGAVLVHAAEQALSVLGLDPATRVDPTVPLKEAGLDSLMAVELRNALARSTGHTLSATLLFDHPSLDALTNHLMKKLKLLAPEPQVAAAWARGASVGTARALEVAELSDAEAEAQLWAELDGNSGRSGR